LLEEVVEVANTITVKGERKTKGWCNVNVKAFFFIFIFIFFLDVKAFYSLTIKAAEKTEFKEKVSLVEMSVLGFAFRKSQLWTLDAQACRWIYIPTLLYFSLSFIYFVVKYAFRIKFLIFDFWFYFFSQLLLQVQLDD
jgi:hypothetical protein